MDPEILQLVQTMNKLPGCRTFASCWGHPDCEDRGPTWVNFTVDLNRLTRFLTVCKQFPFNQSRYCLLSVASVQLSIFPSELTGRKKGVHGSVEINYLHGYKDPELWKRCILEVSRVIETIISNKGGD